MNFRFSKIGLIKFRLVYVVSSRFGENRFGENLFGEKPIRRKSFWRKAFRRKYENAIFKCDS